MELLEALKCGSEPAARGGGAAASSLDAPTARPALGTPSMLWPTQSGTSCKEGPKSASSSSDGPEIRAMLSPWLIVAMVLILSALTALVVALGLVHLYMTQQVKRTIPPAASPASPPQTNRPQGGADSAHNSGIYSRREWAAETMAGLDRDARVPAVYVRPEGRVGMAGQLPPNAPTAFGVPMSSYVAPQATSYSQAGAHTHPSGYTQLPLAFVSAVRETVGAVWRGGEEAGGALEEANTVPPIDVREVAVAVPAPVVAGSGGDVEETAHRAVGTSERKPNGHLPPMDIPMASPPPSHRAGR